MTKYLKNFDAKRIFFLYFVSKPNFDNWIVSQSLISSILRLKKETVILNKNNLYVS